MADTGDFLLDENGMQVYNGDFLTGDATLQHQKHLLLTGKGGAKNHPQIGVGIQNYLNDDIKPFELASEIAVEFEKDGMKVNKIQVDSPEESIIDAHYEN